MNPLQKLSALFLLLAACSRAESGSSAPDRADSAAATFAGVPVAYRLPARGGTVMIYRLPTLAPVKWNAGEVRAPRTAVGMDLVGRRLVYRDSAGLLVSYDLVASRERVIAPRGSIAALGADGTLLAVDPGGSVIESQPWGTRTWSGSLGRGVRAAFATPGAQLIVVRDVGGDSLAVASRETGVAATHPVPESRARTATRDGDAVAFGADSGIVVVEEGGADTWFVRLPAPSAAVTFSPSGHRLYAALDGRPEIAVVDRFARRERGTLDLPAPAAELRADEWGRVLLAHEAGSGAPRRTWVVSLSDGEVVGTLTTSWDSDLPAVSEEGVLLVRQPPGVVARDVRTLDSLGALAIGAGDLWFAGRGSPPPVTAGLRAVADSARRGPRAGAPRPAPAGATWWVQVSVSRNEAWARALAEELNAAQHRVQVVAPADSTSGWRVMTGPHRSREAADSAGRALGRPYWVVERAGTARTPR